ncbi:hypothetical protein H9L39_10127 [Fusarium oxysporum f. sp. albedinis]|nr:hypothetical protein H9L39_10127 [Fusarium oxysporum f. sp. albedinis]
MGLLLGIGSMSETRHRTSRREPLSRHLLAIFNYSLQLLTSTDATQLASLALAFHLFKVGFTFQVEQLRASGIKQKRLGSHSALAKLVARVGVYAKSWQVKQEKRKLASSCWHTELAILQSSVLFALHSLYRGLDNSRATMGSPKKEVEQTESNRQFGENCNTPTR